MNGIKHTPGPLMVDGNTAEIPFRVFSHATQGNVGFFYAEADAALFAASSDMATALEMVAAEDDAARKRTGQPLLTSGVRLVLDAALIKAGRKKAPEPVRHITIAGVDR